MCPSSERKGFGAMAQGQGLASPPTSPWTGSEGGQVTPAPPPLTATPGEGKGRRKGEGREEGVCGAESLTSRPRDACGAAWRSFPEGPRGLVPVAHGSACAAGDPGASRGPGGPSPGSHGHTGPGAPHARGRAWPAQRPAPARARLGLSRRGTRGPLTDGGQGAAVTLVEVGPGLGLAVLAAGQHAVAAGAGRQAHPDRPAALVAELEEGDPAGRTARVGPAVWVCAAPGSTRRLCPTRVLPGQGTQPLTIQNRDRQGGESKEGLGRQTWGPPGGASFTEPSLAHAPPGARHQVWGRPQACPATPTHGGQGQRHSQLLLLGVRSLRARAPALQPVVGGQLHCTPRDLR